MINPFSVVTTLLSVKAAPAGRRSSAIHGRFIRSAYRFGNVHRRCVRTFLPRLLPSFVGLTSSELSWCALAFSPVFLI
jgi:hypothetical protein